MSGMVDRGNSKRVQAIIHMDEKVAESMKLTAESLGFGSRNAYLAFLHHALGSAAQLDRVSRRILEQLGEYSANFAAGTPNVAKLAGVCDAPEAAVRKSLERLKHAKLLVETEDFGGNFAGEVVLASAKKGKTGRAYMITEEGRASARASILMDRITYMGR